MDVMKELAKLTIRKPIVVSKVEEDVVVENDYEAYSDSMDNHDQFDVDGFCVFCGDHKSKRYHYKCWR